MGVRLDISRGCWLAVKELVGGGRSGLEPEFPGRPSEAVCGFLKAHLGASGSKKADFPCCPGSQWAPGSLPGEVGGDL